jgi:hypothetical protein
MGFNSAFKELSERGSDKERDGNRISKIKTKTNERINE